MISAVQRRMTDQQQAAVDWRAVSVVLSSGAGCGKTSVLTERYLSHLIRDGFNVGQMVAITFTDKAAREMRQRIREAIEAEYAAAKGDTKDGWQLQLLGLETASISTIHSFCGQLLKHYALAAGLDPGFQILDEAIAPNLLEAAVRDTLAELLIQESPTGEALRELVSWHGWSAVRHSINGLVTSRDRHNWATWLEKKPEHIANEWFAYAEKELIPKFWQEWNGTEGVGTLLEFLKSIEAPNEKFVENVAIILGEWPKLLKSKEPANVLTTIREAAKVQGVVTKKSWPSPDIYERVSGGFKKFRDLIDNQMLPLLNIPEETSEAARFGQMFLRVASECVQAFHEKKLRHGYLDFDDLLVRARDLLQSRSEVRAECQARYRVILVDELQDTDRLQMELVDLLCGAAKKKGKLFAVGDAEQSIYRFRGADVEGFNRLRSEIPESGRLPLSVNFRSQPGILHFTNALLGLDMPDYESLVAQVTSITKGPHVEFLWGSADDDVETNRRLEAGRIARRIVGMIRNKEQLVSNRPRVGTPGPRPAKLGDIVMLFRSMTNVAIYEEALREAGIDYYLVGGRAFYAQQEIYDQLNLFRALENPHDTLCLAGVLRSPFGCVSDEALYMLAQHPGGLWKGLCDAKYIDQVPAYDRDAVQRIAHWLVKWRSLKDRLNIVGLINQILADSGYDAALRFEPLGERKLANLWKLLDQARTFDAAGSFTLADFIERLNEIVAAQPREEQAATQPEESDVVRIMSIHQAKGLEFPIVFVPDLASKTQGPREAAALWDSDLGCVPRPPSDEDPLPYPEWPRTIWNLKERLADKQESLRILYVACTRAMDYLVLSASLDSAKVDTNPAIALLSKRFDLTSGICRDESINSGERPAVKIGIDDIMNNRLNVAKSNVDNAPLSATNALRVRPIKNTHSQSET